MEHFRLKRSSPKRTLDKENRNHPGLIILPTPRGIENNGQLLFFSVGFSKILLIDCRCLLKPPFPPFFSFLIYPGEERCKGWRDYPVKNGSVECSVNFGDRAEKKGGTSSLWVPPLSTPSSPSVLWESRFL
ncbi:hypothetical protein CDAR_498421 [Caerostris darwini]|uniref:Uncharacterized protein n=1 Tax=Caerostris darwini TaxID=1538125 RepID=A0AAV4PW31_9ARAC|nr:hypothetical protein CDAR_498421 [Caerostris darwini]